MSQFALGTEIMEGEWKALFRVSCEAFKDQPEVLAFSPGGLDSEHRETNVRNFQATVFGGPTERCYAKITDSQSGDPIAFISSRVFRGPMLNAGEAPRTLSRLEMPYIVDAREREWYEWYWNSVRASMQELEEMRLRPIVFIQALATRPDWQGHGAASMLMNWTVEWARKEKIGRCALQASPVAVKTGFYEKFGFRAVKHHTFVDEEHFPGRQGTSIVSMIKDL